MPDSAAIWFYLGTFGLLLAAGLGLPLPEEIPIVVAGASVGHAAEPSDVPAAVVTAFTASPLAGFPANLPWTLLVSNNLEVPRASPLPSSLRWWIMLPICILGAVTGDVFLYGMGRLGGPRLLNSRWMKKLLPPDKRQKVEDNFHRFGVSVLIFARFLPTIRSPIFVVAGIMRVPFARFLLADGLAGCIGVSLLFTLAFWFGDQFRELVERAEGNIQKLKPLLILLGLTAVLTYLFLHFLRRPVTTGDPHEVPLIGDKVIAKMESLHLLPGAPSADHKETTPKKDEPVQPPAQADQAPR
ncbi:MAG TPA: DedA family protein [Gemmataceae bacterium]|nr:DedA family protein [Gemmataceae bacterium]